ncbi:MAG: anti-sigma factor [Pseudomonas sp.]|nr:anti-sigma factor [Pseudomonas sp.]
MKTDDLINLLSTGVAPIDRRLPAKRFGIAVLVGILGACLLVAAVLGVRADLVQVATTPIFWAKIALPLGLMIGALQMVTRLARPGMTGGKGGLWIVAAIAAVTLGGIYIIALAAPDTRVALVLGKTWRVCAINITVLSIPGFIAVFWALRGLAPTRLRLAGACGGLLASSMATLAYCLHCPEMEVPFWGCWYVLGMLVPTLIGAAIGPRWLRW